MLKEIFGDDIMKSGTGEGRGQQHQWTRQHCLLQSHEEQEVDFIGQAFERALRAKNQELEDFLVGSALWGALGQGLSRQWQGFEESVQSPPRCVLAQRVLLFLSELASFNLLDGGEQESLIRLSLARARDLAGVIACLHYRGTGMPTPSSDSATARLRVVLRESGVHPVGLVLLMLVMIFTRGPSSTQRQGQDDTSGGGGSWSFEGLLWVDQCQLYYFRLLQKHLHTKGPVRKKKKVLASWPTKAMGKLVRVMTLLQGQ